jgi:hypothetical protein
MLRIAHLVDENSEHICLGSFQTPESTTEIELYVVFLSFHTNSDQNPALCIEIHPQLVGQEIAEPSWIEAEVRAPDNIVFSNKRTISHRNH